MPTSSSGVSSPTEDLHWPDWCSQGICDLANKYRRRSDGRILFLHYDTFNVTARVHWDDNGRDWLIRFTLPGKSSLMDDKVQTEAAAMKYVSTNTPIPVPRVIAHGSAKENPMGLGAFIIMTWVEGRKMSDILHNENDGNAEENQQTIERLYEQMAEILIELWKLNFERIGSFGHNAMTGKIAVDRRPFARAVNEVMRVCELGDHPSLSRTYNSASDYILMLLELQYKHLRRHHGAMGETASYQEQYAARHLMKAIAPNFLSLGENYGPFKLFAEGFSPDHILVDENLQVTGVVNWEFCYSAPVQFASTIPCWLLPQTPDRMIESQGHASFIEAYLPKADLFLRVLERQENRRGQDSDGQLSTRMRRSIEDNSAWFNLACRSVTCMNVIYWNLLDEYCWGPRSSVGERAHATTSTGMHRKIHGHFHRKSTMHEKGQTWKVR